MTGLQKLCKIYGSIEVSDSDGKKVVWVWDYANDGPRLKTEMKKEEIEASEKAKIELLKSAIKQIPKVKSTKRNQ